VELRAQPETMSDGEMEALLNNLVKVPLGLEA